MTQEMGQIDFEILFFERLIASKNDFVEAMIPLADAYTQKGMIEKGYALDLRLSQLKPRDESVFYNLACSEALLGKRDEAIRSLRTAVELGYLDLVHLLGDKDLSSLQDLPEFLVIVNSLKTRLRSLAKNRGKPK
ncbi:MAG: hypothetical protein A2036_03985 [Omnitrophica bacterium GWA2_50_21]|nr:MAG: hypothetical protein A2036_03985 [Omnitrophica bacterium GWA2_50_21]